MPVVHKILVAFDDPASRTLEHAADLALALRLRADRPRTSRPRTTTTRPRKRGNYGGERLDQAGEYLAGPRSQRRGRRGRPASRPRQSSRSPRSANVDLIVVGMRKKGFLERLVEGSVAQDVMRRATCDVLAVH